MKFYCIYGLVHIEHNDDTIVLRTQKRNIDELKAEEIMQDYVDEHRDEFKGKKVVCTMQYCIDCFKAIVV